MARPSTASSCLGQDQEQRHSQGQGLRWNFGSDKAFQSAIVSSNANEKTSTQLQSPNIGTSPSNMALQISRQSNEPTGYGAPLQQSMQMNSARLQQQEQQHIHSSRSLLSQKEVSPMSYMPETQYDSQSSAMPSTEYLSRPSSAQQVSVKPPAPQLPASMASRMMGQSAVPGGSNANMRPPTPTFGGWQNSQLGQVIFMIKNSCSCS